MGGDILARAINVNNVPENNNLRRSMNALDNVS
jgi:hypothetical protein